jgi:hypothetical protein
VCVRAYVGNEATVFEDFACAAGCAQLQTPSQVCGSHLEGRRGWKMAGLGQGRSAFEANIRAGKCLRDSAFLFYKYMRLAACFISVDVSKSTSSAYVDVESRK